MAGVILRLGLVGMLLAGACGDSGDEGGSHDDSGSDDVASAIPGPPVPALPGDCPELATGMVTVRGQQVRLWVGTPEPDEPAPIFFYFHGTGSSANEAESLLAGPIAEIVAAGGMVASFTTSTGTGPTTSGNNVWNKGDYGMSDDLFACAVEQLNIDTRRVYAGGCSAGGTHASMLVFERSSYMAGAMPNSGGFIISAPGLEDRDRVPTVITAHGGSQDVVMGAVFSRTSMTLYSNVAARGGYAANCNHGGNHCGVTPEITAAQWRYLMAHPFGVEQDPYPEGLPDDFPSFCEKIAKR